MSKSTQKERPILFSGEMVRAILDGRKTQTRRVIKPQPVIAWKGAYPRKDGSWEFMFRPPLKCVITGNAEVRTCSMPFRCPYGGPSDRLWVRETWCTHRAWDNLPPREVPQHEFILYAHWEGGEMFWDGGTREEMARFGKTRPSIFMPRWASRITLEVTSVKVERVQDISWSDAIAEGCKDPRRCAIRIDPANPNSPVFQFRELWDSINAKRGYGWEENPWVFVVEFL